MPETGPIIAALDTRRNFVPVAQAANRLALCLQAPLQLVAVFDESTLGVVNEFGMGLTRTLALETEESEKALELRRTIESRLQLEGEASRRIVILEGSNVARTLIEHATRENAGMMVLGQPHSRFGSVALALAKNAPCDLHIVRVDD